MSGTHLLEEIEETQVAIRRLNQSLGDQAPSRAYSLNRRSLEKRLSRLEESFKAECKRSQTDVCRYRVFAEDSTQQLFPIANICGALSSFQSLLNLIVDATINGPRKSVRVRKKTVERYSLNFGYSFTGSVGFVMTVPNERELLDTVFDDSVKSFTEMAQVRDAEEILKFSKVFGPAAVSTLFRWAESHARAQLGAEIRWTQSHATNESPRPVIVQRSQMEALRDTISQTNDVTEEEIVTTIDLRGADVDTRAFHGHNADLGDIRGRISDQVFFGESLELERFYRCTLKVSKTVYFATEKEETNYRIEEMELLPSF